MIILSLMEKEPAAMRRAILSAPEKADAIEVRLDAVPDAHPEMLFETAPRPVIAACRRRADGGLFRGTERARCQRLQEAVRAGASFVDVELDSLRGPMADLLETGHDAGVIVSRHMPARPPRDLDRLYERMARIRGARAVKIVLQARGPADVLAVRDFLARHRGATPPLISFCMGGPGTLSRILALQWGSWATYACVEAGSESAPGQVSLPDLIGTYRIEEIDEETRLAGIIGCPLGHTLSPAMHNAAYHADGLNFRYLPLEIPTARHLRDLPAVMRELRIRGVSVTSPWKLAAADLCDRLEPAARRVGAVNTIVWDGRRLMGFNTDVTGGMGALSEALAAQGLKPAGLTVAVLGAGGAARALSHACAWAGSTVLVASRSAPRGRRLAREVGGRYVEPSRLGRERYDVLINCTPLGQVGRQVLAVPPTAVKGRLIYDVVYNPETTRLLERARSRGIATLGGLEMLVRQAAEQYALFTGREAPVDVMREAARQTNGSLEPVGSRRR